MLCALTPGQKLSTWEKMGTLDRELQPYKHYVNLGGNVTFLELKLGRSPVPQGMSVVSLPNWRLLFAWARLPKVFLPKIDIIKTNQSFNAHLFVKLAQSWHLPIILRCGMVYGERIESVEGLTENSRRYQSQEAWAFQNCTLAEVPTYDLAEWVEANYLIPKEKIRIVPNFVDTQKFIPRNIQTFGTEMPLRIISVGRLNPIKRFDLLIQACSKVCLPLLIAGQGQESENLLSLAKKIGVDLQLLGQIPHSQLPNFLQQGDIFVITSLREGHPKSVIEAMACGLPCVCVDVPGIRNIIKNGVNGLLVDANPISIASGINKLISNPELRQQIGCSARDYAQKHFDIKEVLKMDAKVIDEALGLFNDKG